MLAAGYLGCALPGATPLEELIGMPTSPRRHEQLAELYERKAREARAQAARHLAIAASYRDSAASADSSEAAIRRGIVQHCEALARDYEDAAARYAAMAANHRLLANMERAAPERERREDEPGPGPTY